MFLQVSVIPFTGGAWSRGMPGPRGCAPGGVPGGDPPDGYCSGRYASYWNAFLFVFAMVARVDH